MTNPFQGMFSLTGDKGLNVKGGKKQKHNQFKSNQNLGVNVVSCIQHF